VLKCIPFIAYLNIDIYLILIFKFSLIYT